VKEMLRYGFTLTVICIVASGLLAGVNVLTKSRIAAQAQAEEDASLNEVLPEAAHFETVKSGEEIIYYKAHDKEKRLLGAAFRASGRGYSSTIETMVGMLKDGTIKAIKILSQNETPGLGARVTEDSFTSRFSNRGWQNLSEVDAITGATISSRAVIDSVKKKAEEIKALLENVPKDE
jgi:electron transport complex protein RnfG